MDYCFDSVTIKNNTVTIVGWAAADNPDNHIVIYATDARGKRIECRVTRAGRPDVGLAVYQDTGAADVGIFLEIPIPQSPFFTVHLDETTVDGRVLDSKREPYNTALVVARMSYKRLHMAYVNTKKTAKRLTKKAVGKEYAAYDDWFHIMKVVPAELNIQRKRVFSWMPKFSVVVPVYNTQSLYLRAMIQSMVSQSYANWELILVNASPENARVSRLLSAWSSHDSRIRIIKQPDNPGIAENTNVGLAAATGDFIGFMDHDDALEPDALYCYVDLLNEKPDTDLIYCDEDKIAEDDNTYFYPHFKPDYNPDLLCSNNYINHFLCVRRELLKKTGGLDPQFNGAQDYDLIFRLTEKTTKIEHCAKVLYHWRAHSGSTAQAQGNKTWAFDAGMRAVNAHYKRCNIPAAAQIGPVDGWYTTRYTLKEHPLVSIIIPNKDHVDDLDKCIQSLLDRSLYDNFEIVIVENNSTDPDTFHYYESICARDNRIRTVYWKHDFNYSAINNFGRSFCKGEYLLLLNNDVEVISQDILENMLGYAMRDEVGIVGAKLLYDDHTVQHAGVLVGAGGLADHMFKGIHEDAPGYMGRAVATQDLSAVTAACLMIRASVYDEVGGLDEAFKVAFNDVDLCLKVRKAGYLVVYDADVRLYHYESKSRGSEDTPERFVRFGDEMQRLNAKWNILTGFTDPYYNPNLSYIDYFNLNYVELGKRQKMLAQYQKENYGKEESHRRHSKL